MAQLVLHFALLTALSNAYYTAFPNERPGEWDQASNVPILAVLIVVMLAALAQHKNPTPNRQRSNEPGVPPRDEQTKMPAVRRCKVVHEDPTLIATAADTIRSTILVLRELYVAGLEQDEGMLAELQRLSPGIGDAMQEQLKARRQHKRRMRKDKPK